MECFLLRVVIVGSSLLMNQQICGILLCPWAPSAEQMQQFEEAWTEDILEKALVAEGAPH